MEGRGKREVVRVGEEKGGEERFGEERFKEVERSG